MPAILRNSLPKLLASHTRSGQSPPFGVVVGSRPSALPPCGPWPWHRGLQHDKVGSVGLGIGAGHLRLRLGLLLDLMPEICRIGHEAHDCYVEQYR